MDRPPAALGPSAPLCGRPQCPNAPACRPARPLLAPWRRAASRRHAAQARAHSEGPPQVDARQCGCWGRARRRRRPVQAISADTARSDLGAVGPQPSAAVPLRPLELNRLTTRVLFGSLMGAAGAAVILAGGWVFTAVTCAVVYQASQEFYGFVTSKVRPRSQAQAVACQLREVARLCARRSPRVHGRATCSCASAAAVTDGSGYAPCICGSKRAPVWGAQALALCRGLVRG